MEYHQHRHHTVELCPYVHVAGCIQQSMTQSDPTSRMVILSVPDYFPVHQRVGVLCPVGPDEKGPHRRCSDWSNLFPQLTISTLVPHPNDFNACLCGAACPRSRSRIECGLQQTLTILAIIRICGRISGYVQFGKQRVPTFVQLQSSRSAIMIRIHTM